MVFIRQELWVNVLVAIFLGTVDLEKMLNIQNFFFFLGGGGVSKVCYGNVKEANREYTKTVIFQFNGKILKN